MEKVMQLTESQRLSERAREVIPAGVNSNFRYWGPDSPIMVRGEGSHIWDADGNEFLDYRMGHGPIILGHADKRVNQHVTEVMSQGTVFAHTHPLEIKVAEKIVEMCSGVDKVRFTNSGTEATMHALRIARAHTNREKIIKFEGFYHGSHDYVMFSSPPTAAYTLGSSRSPVPVPSSSGIPKAIHELIYVLPFNDFEMLERTVKAKWGDVAAIILEPMGSLGCVMPEPGFLQFIRKLCDEFGIVMIMDEVKTGFRMAKGGAAQYFGVKADLSTYAKAVSNGFPLAVLGGNNEVMSVLEPGRVEHAGTYNGNLVGMAAAEATLDILANTDALKKIDATGKRLMQGIDGIFTEAGIEHVVTGVPSLFTFLFDTSAQPKNIREALATNLGAYADISRAMRSRGVEYDSGPGNWFVCEAHSDKDVDLTLNALNDSVNEVFKKKNNHR